MSIICQIESMGYMLIRVEKERRECEGTNNWVNQVLCFPEVFSYFQEYNPDVMDRGSILQTEVMSRRGARRPDARVILGATVGVTIYRYAHED